MDGGGARHDDLASIPANWHKVFAHELDEVGWEEPNRTSVTPQATHPPLSISRI